MASAHHEFCDMFIGKINSTLTYIPFVILLFSVTVQSSAKRNEY